MDRGLFPQGTKLAPPDARTPDWAILDDQSEMDLRMAIHAAMVHLLDEGVGRVVAKPPLEQDRETELGWNKRRAVPADVHRQGKGLPELR